MKQKRFLKIALASAIAVAGLGFSTSAVDAKPSSKGGGGTSGGGSQSGYLAGTCNLADVFAGNVGASACGNFSGNDSNSGFLEALNNDTVSTLGGYKSANPDFATQVGALDGTWSLFGKSDESGDFVNNIGGELQSGNWSLTKSLDNPFVVVLKASNYYSAYLFKDFDEAIQSGTFNVKGVTSSSKGGSKSAALSHLSVYSFVPRVKEPAPVDIPEPTAVLSLFVVAGVGYRCKRSVG